MIRFCIIVPTYNRPELLAEALHSLQAQTYPNWTAIVVNDASTKDYGEVERSFGDDSRIRFVRKEKNEGVNGAWNTGIETALKHDVDYVGILDDDDRYAPDYFEAAQQVIRAHPEYGWFMSNNFGEDKESARSITEEGEMDYVDDYIYRKFRGDKARLIAADILRDVFATTRLDVGSREPRTVPFFIEVGKRTKIWAYPHDSTRKRYLGGGITKNARQSRPVSPNDIIYPVRKHWSVIKHRPGKMIAYKYFFLEIIKVPGRMLCCLGRRIAT